MALKIINGNITVLEVSRVETRELIRLLTASLQPQSKSFVVPVLTIKEQSKSTEEFVFLLKS